MKWIKRFNENIEQFDLDFALAKIKENFPINKVLDLLDKEKLNWIPDGKDSEHYSKNSNGEAEDVLISHMIDWYFIKYPTNETEENEEILKSGIQKSYEFLKLPSA